MIRAWEKEKKTLARIYRGITKKKTKIIDIPAGAGELGFTSADGNIHLAQEHPIMDGLDADEKKFFRMGVFAHEMLHQIYSDFKILEETQAPFHPMERTVYANLFNLIEDPAIEFMAPDVIGGSVLKALHFMIQTVYRKTPDIDVSPEGFTQYVNALVMFGDMGILKGHFTDELAAGMFQKTCGRFNEAVENPDPKFRSDMAVELMEETRPLWENISHDDLEKMLGAFPGHEAEEIPADSRKVPMPAGKGKKPDSASKARKKIISAMESAPGNGSSAGEENEKTPSRGALDEETQEDGSSSIEEPEGTPSGTDNRETERMNDINEKLDASDDREETTVDENDLAWMEEADRSSEKELRTEEKEAENPPLDESIEPSFYPKGKYTVKNFNVYTAEDAAGAYAEKYGRILQKYAVSRSAFVKRLERIFDTDRTKKEYKKSGKVNIKRYTGSRKTARIFERKSAPKGIDDLAVTILVDESGSMNAVERGIPVHRCEIAQECAIMLTESFADLKIPVYVLGFSADEYGGDAVHYHYIKWKNTLKERYLLLQIRGRENNFDSLSVNYAAEILKKRRAEHKLLIVISDWVPACYAINHGQGIADTKESIRMARKHMDVLGIAIGNDSTKEIQYMYGKDFIHITDVNAAFTDISKEITGIVKRW